MTISRNHLDDLMVAMFFSGIVSACLFSVWAFLNM